MSTPDLTATSYAILGLLAIKPWTTYELAQQMDRSLKNFWPRAASRIYEEPKRLAARGLANASKDPVGRRPRTVYSITPDGRRALSQWLDEPGAGPTIEFEALLKIFFAENTTRDAVLTNLEAIRRWAAQQNAENIAFARLYTETGGPFPDRLAAITLTGKFLTDFADMLDGWARWATDTIDTWPDDPATADPDWDTLRAIAQREINPTSLPGL